MSKDSNIANDLGHTYYPKWIKKDGKDILVKDADEEAAIAGKKSKKEENKEEKTEETATNPWPKSNQ